MPLQEALEDWLEISRSLSEPMRKRRPQMNRFLPRPQPKGERQTS